MTRSNGNNVSRLEASGAFGTAFQKALQSNNLSLTAFARKIDANYEVLRKALKGIPPSENVLSRICGPLALDIQKMRKLVQQDRAQRKNAKEAIEVAGRAILRDSGLQDLLPYLSEQEIVDLVDRIKPLVNWEKHVKGL